MEWNGNLGPRAAQENASGAGDHTAAVAFCADRAMDAPLHVAASSLLRHLRADYAARFYFLLTGFSSADVRWLQRTLDSVGRAYTMTILDNEKIHLPPGLPPLSGSLATYYRLLLPEMVDEKRLLYLDSDTIIGIDVAPLFEEDLGTAPAGFVMRGEVSWALDSRFQISIGRSPQAPAFNAGVVLFNLPEWHRQECSPAVWEFASKHRAELGLCYDQTVLNALFADRCHHLPPEFNIGFSAETPGDIPETGIIHFFGNPKPWDIGARFFFPSAARWFEELRKTAMPLSRRVPWFNWTSWARVPRVLGGYKRAFISMYADRRRRP
jgi:lipopolysaccharide biosynthesis glycosyltransferase